MRNAKSRRAQRDLQRAESASVAGGGILVDKVHDSCCGGGSALQVVFTVPELLAPQLRLLLLVSAGGSLGLAATFGTAIGWVRSWRRLGGGWRELHFLQCSRGGSCCLWLAASFLDASHGLLTMWLWALKLT